MCGIIGIIGKDAAAGPLLDALKRLEYRGYDSAGIATICEVGARSRTIWAGSPKRWQAGISVCRMAESWTN